MDSADFRQWFNYGVPTFILLLSMYGVWKVVTWAKAEMGPLLVAHIRLINSLQEQLTKQTEILMVRSDLVEELKHHMPDQKRASSELLVESKRHTELLQAIIEAVKK